MTPCLGCGVACAGPRCKQCQRQHKAKYSAASGHPAERRAWAPLVARGEITCSAFGILDECPGRIEPGDPWDLGHYPPPSRPQHRRCNRVLGGQGR